MKSEIEISFSSLHSYTTRMEMLLDLFQVSKSQLKKMGLKKKFLEQSIQEKEEQRLPLRIVNHKRINPFYTERKKVKLIEDSKYFLALSKPAQIHSHPLDYIDTTNVLSGMYELNLGQFLGVNQDHYDRGLLYRLDYETSGLILYAKDDETYNSIRENFKSYVESKDYLAVVNRGIKSGSYSHLVRPYGSKGSKMIEDENGSQVDIQVEVLAESLEYSLIKVGLKQGKRHQIRVQLAILGYPIIGDALYDGDDFDRLMLHCFEYKINYNGESFDFRDKNFEKLKLFFADFN